MGREGVAFTFVAPEEGPELTRIEQRINLPAKRGEVDISVTVDKDRRARSRAERAPASAPPEPPPPPPPPSRITPHAAPSPRRVTDARRRQAAPRGPAVGDVPRSPHRTSIPCVAYGQEQSHVGRLPRKTGRFVSTELRRFCDVPRGERARVSRFGRRIGLSCSSETLDPGDGPPAPCSAGERDQ